MVKKKLAPGAALPENLQSPQKLGLQTGQLVRSLSGRDKDRYYLVLGCVKNTLYLVDGRKRAANNPKKKNIRHVQRLNRIAADAVAAAPGRLLRDEEIRAGIRELLSGE